MPAKLTIMNITSRSEYASLFRKKLFQEQEVPSRHSTIEDRTPTPADGVPLFFPFFPVFPLASRLFPELFLFKVKKSLPDLISASRIYAGNQRRINRLLQD